MLSRYNPIDIEQAIHQANPAPPFPPASDRRAWEDLRASLGEDRVRQIIDSAVEAANESIPDLPATLYLEFSRNGQREGYERPARLRRERLTNLAIAECFERRGRFLDPILNLAWAICEESSWSWPAHQRALTDMDHPIIDLSVAMTALKLAELDLLLGSDLEPLLGKRIRYEVNRRCFTPYLTRHDHHWLYNTDRRTVNNWTGVCNAGVVGAATYLEPDPARLAEMIARAARSLDDYLSTFDADGGSSEGPGYWSYGFGYYTMLAHLVEHRTDGKISFLEEEGIRDIAQYPLRTVLSPGLYVNFSDCDQHVRFIPSHLAYLSRRLDLPDLMAFARQQGQEQPALVPRRGELAWAIRRLFWRPSAEGAASFTPSAHDWFSEMHWMIARMNPSDPNALVLAAKGGNNGEMHNQNDVGNLIVHVNGESVVADIGRGRYTREYFGPQRYNHLVNSSLGHSVPVVNGKEQLPGKQHAAKLLEHRSDGDVDLIRIELRDVYPEEADLESLERTIALHREQPNGWVELTDEVRFRSAPGDIESVLTTFGKLLPEKSGDVTIQGENGRLRVLYDGDSVQLGSETKSNVDLSEGPADVERIIFTFPTPSKSATIKLRIQPA